MKRVSVIKSIVVCCGTFLSICSYGQSDSLKLQDLTLKELLNTKVSTVSKTLQEMGLAPGIMIVITKEQIRSRGYQSLLDVMYDLPDIKVDDKIYSGIRNSFTIRGTQGSEKLIVMLDGVSISSPSGEAMPVMENYPVNLARQIEIVYGPASALYGANAVSGIINIITRTPVSNRNLTFDASVSGGQYGYTNSTVFISKKLDNNFTITVSGQYAYDNGADYSRIYKDDNFLNIDFYANGTFNTIYGPVKPLKPVNPVYEAPMKAYNIYTALHAGDFSFAFFKNSTRVPTAFGNNTSNAVYNKDAFMAQSVTTASASYKKAFEKITTSTSLTASQYNLDPKSNYRNLYTGMEPGYKYSTCSMVKGEQQVDYKASGNLNITAGSGYESYNSVPQSSDLEKPVNTDNFIQGSYLGTKSYYQPAGLAAPFYFIKYYNLGTYLQAQYSPGKKINFTFGARYDINSRYGNSFNPRAGIVYKLSYKTTVKALYGTAFLAPSPTDSYSQYGSFDTPDSGRSYHSYFLHMPNPGLKPITSKNAELSIRHALTDNFIITFDGYYTWLSGLHEYSDDNLTTRLYNNDFNGIPVDYIEVFTNNNRQKNWGGSIQLSWKHSYGRMKLTSFMALSYVNGRFENSLNEDQETHKDMELDFIAPFMLHLGLDIKVGKFSCSPRLILSGRQNLTGVSDTTATVIKRQTIPGYSVLNVSFRYNCTKSVSLFANITNALNQRYRNVGFNMDLKNQNTDLFYGQRQDPIRITGGLNLGF